MNSTGAEFDNLITWARGGDWKALAQLVTQRKDRFLRIAYSYCSSDQDVEDIMSQTIVEAYQGITKLKKPEFFYTWYTKILINNCIQWKKRGSREVLKMGEENNTLWEGELFCSIDQAMSIDQRMDVINAIEKLPEKQGVVVKLRFYSDMKIEEIAQVLDINKGTVKSRLHSALARLGEILNNGGAANV